MKAVTPTHKTGLMTGPLPTTAGEAGTDNDKGQLGIGFYSILEFTCINFSKC